MVDAFVPPLLLFGGFALLFCGPILLGRGLVARARELRRRADLPPAERAALDAADWEAAGRGVVRIVKLGSWLFVLTCVVVIAATLWGMREVAHHGPPAQAARPVR